MSAGGSTDGVVRGLADLSAATLRELGATFKYDEAAKRFREMAEVCWETHAACHAHQEAVKAAFAAANRVLDRVAQVVAEAATPADEAAP